MKIKNKYCSRCGKLRVIWKNYKGERYCQYCWNVLNVTDSKIKPTKLKSLPRSSFKHSQEEREYLKLRKVFLLKHPLCQANIPGICTKHSTDVHHKRGRGIYYLNTKYWLSTCRECHNWIENNRNAAKDLGFLIKK